MGVLDWLRRATMRTEPAATPAAPPVPSDRFDACLAIVLHHEAGFVMDPVDPGGATNMGITHRTLSEWRKRPVTADDVRRLAVKEASDIYRARYWQVMRCGEMPAGVDLVVFDFGVNAGPGRAARMLQNCLNVPADGLIGPITLRAAGAAEAGPLIDRLSQWRVTYYRSLPTFARFGRGWLRRTEDVRQRAHVMTG